MVTKKGTPTYSMNRAARKTKGVEIMLSDELREKLERLAEAHPTKTKSGVVSELIDLADEPRKKK